MGKITTAAPSPHNPQDFAAQLAAMQAAMAALTAENEALRQRGARPEGFHVRPVPTAKDPANTGRYLAERVMTGGVVLSLFVGPNGKLSFGGGFGSRAFGLWGGEIEAFLTYAESGALRADLSRPDLRAHVAAAYRRS